MHFSLLNFNLFLLINRWLSRIFNSFKKQQVVACRFSKIDLCKPEKWELHFTVFKGVVQAQNVLVLSG
jgi:hypothetical protein